jgi:enamine deaminase RidA (YjgF/YER057c/UK114 family)
LSTSFTAISTVTTAISHHKVLGSVSPASPRGNLGTKSLALPDGLTPESLERSTLSLNIEDVGSLLRLAITAGNAILGALKSLQSAVAVADQTSLVSSSFGLKIDETRISRLNIQSQFELTAERVKDLVEASEFAGGNLIFSEARNIALQTSAFGGSLTIAPQALDFEGLGIGDLDLMTDGGVNSAVAAVEKALDLAGLRLDRLVGLQKALNDPGAFSSGFSRVLGSGTSDVLPRGSLVNLEA